MGERIDRALDRLYPSMGARPLWMTCTAVLCMVVYEHHGSFSATPAWFVGLGRRITSIEQLRFHEHGWSHTVSLLVLMLVPLMLARVLSGLRPVELGLGVREAGREILVVLGMWAAFLPVLWLVSATDAFARTYPRFPPAATSFALFAAYEGLYLVKWISWEFFFRGFMLFGFARDLGTRAVLVSTIPFVLMHFGKPELEVVASLPAGLILCWIALRSRSIWPGVLLHWMVATSMDFFASTWWRAGG
jgi:membrane protease YdiL (CAAX protease family)